MEQPTRLNLGSGDKLLPGYENLDIKTGQRAYPLPYASETIDEVRASHLLEHFPTAKVPEVLAEWVRVLKPGGLLKVAVPDFAYVAKRYARGEPVNAEGYLMGGQVDGNDFHASLFDCERLHHLLKAAGLQSIQLWNSEVDDCASLPVSLNLQGTKPDVAQTSHSGPTTVTDVSLPAIRVMGVMSMPRLCFADNMFAVFGSMAPLGINVERGVGVFWGQVLTRMLESHLDDSDYIVTIDYDSWFVKEHVWRLLQLMQEHPELDAVVPVEVTREGDFALARCSDDLTITAEQLQQELLPIRTGHFGLTILRTAALRELPKPWFLPHPSPDGGWGEGRIDEDIHFWNNWTQSGRTVSLATQVNIIHLQQVGTAPGTAANGYKPIHLYMNDILSGNLPDHIIPKIEVKR